ncbi:MAG: multicopper oxidase domain-containing protein [bacterium]
MRPVVAVLSAAMLAPAAFVHHVADEPNALANDNRTPAGTRVGDTLVLKLTVVQATWRIYGDTLPGFKAAAFAEEGKAPLIPGPLVRIRVGTPIHVVIHNPLGDTLIFRGLTARRSWSDSLLVLPNDSGDARFVATQAGTFMYWGALATEQRKVALAGRDRGLVRPRYDSQLAGAYIVDAPGPVPQDRVLVITERADQVPPSKRDRHQILGREFVAINGRAWPHTERMTYALGDTIRWRIVNPTIQAHPMHLHGFYFRVDSHGSARRGDDSVYTAAQRRMAVTELVRVGETASITWSPDRPGGWIFHCHLTQHAAMLPRVDNMEEIDYPESHDHADPDHHTVQGMNGAILGITVMGRERTVATWRPGKRMRLYVQSDSAPSDKTRRFGYVLQRGAPPKRDSVENPGPVLLLTRGEPTSIEVVNRATEPTAVHWHGIELESYYDGAPGWSGRPGSRTAPAIRPESTFEVRITPKRAGTFMYHTHFNEMRQQYGGLVGALLVLEPGQRWNPSRDLLFLISEADDGSLLINGSPIPPTPKLEVGTTYRLRFANVAVFRPTLFVRVARDSASPLVWRPIAKDGFDLSRARAVPGPSTSPLASGETADFELTPERDGELRLEFGTLSLATGEAMQRVLKLRVAER